jgi:hypothetical protein
MTTPTETAQSNHRRAVRFFWGFLFTSTAVSLLGNIAHAVLPYISRIVIQIGAAAVPPIALLAAVHGLALAVRAGASGRVYCWAVGAVATIGIGAFTVSFLALRDLMLAIGYSASTAWMFPAIIDTAVAVSTLMLVALGDKPVRHSRSAAAQLRGADAVVQSAKSQVKSVSPPRRSAQALRAAPADIAVADADLAAELVAQRVTTQSVGTVTAVLKARRAGASINAAAKAVGVNYRTAQRIVEAGEAREPVDLRTTG